MARFFGICVPLVVLSSSFALRAQELRDYDLGFLKGLGVATTMFGEYESGRGNAGYHCGTYSFRRSVASQVAANLDAEIPSLHDASLRSALTELAKDIRAAAPGGKGDAQYWVAMLERMHVQLQRVVEKRDALAKERILEDTLTSAREVGYLRGLRVGVNSMVADLECNGDTQYYVRLFEIQRETAKIVAKRIRGDAKDIPNAFLRLTLTELAKDILSAPQEGEGNLQYWAGDIRTHQRRVLERVSEKLEAFLNLAASGAPACERLIGDEDAGLPRMSLKDI